MYQIPLTPEPNRTINCSVPVDGKVLDMRLVTKYNGVAGYWFLSVIDVLSNETLIDAVPLLSGVYPSANLLGQYSFL